MSANSGLFDRAGAFSHLLHEHGAIRQPGRNRRKARGGELALRLEPRTLLAVTAGEYATICGTYPEFALPADMAQINIIELTPDQLSLANLRSAITTAGSTDLPDLVVARTTGTLNRITASISTSLVSINIPAATKGAISIVSLGTAPLTLDPNYYAGAISVGGISSTTIVNLGGIAVTHAASSSGGIYQGYGQLRLQRVSISDGAGFTQSRGTSTLTDVTIQRCSGSYGGGVRLYTGAVTTMTRVTLDSNTATQQGAGLYAVSATATLNTVTITRNKAFNGGGVYQDGGNLTFTNAVISGNVADTGNGGGMLVANGTATLVNSVISGNQAWSGGGTDQSRSSLILVNVTVAGNTAGNLAGGCSLYISDITLRNSIVAGNSAGIDKDLSSNAGTFTAANSLVGIGGGYVVNGTNGNIAGTLQSPADPKYRSFTGTDWTAWDLRLAEGSPAIDAGDNALIPAGVTTDLSGGPRISGLRVDMGAYEQRVAPTDISLSTSTVPESRPAGTLVGMLAASPDAGNSFTYTLIPGTGSDDNASFTITGDQLLTAASFDYETKSSYTIRVRATDAAGLWSEKSFTISIIDIDEIAPTIASVSINDGAIQRSMVKKLSVVFSEPVVLSAEAVQVQLRDGSLPPNTTVNMANPSGDQQTYILSFSGTGAVGGSLPDGIYDLIVSAAGVQDLAGNPLSANYSQRFHRLFGDSDGNRIINSLDYARLKQTFGRAPSDPLFNSAFDYEGNTLINALDLARFRQRYGMSFSY